MRQVTKFWARTFYRNMQVAKRDALSEQRKGFPVQADILFYAAKMWMGWFEFVTIGRPKLREEVIRELKE